MNKEFTQSSLLTMMIENNILFFYYKKHLTIDLEVARIMSQHRVEFLNGREFPALADARYLKYVTVEAIRFLSNDGMTGVRALAIVTGNYITVVMANLFMKLSRPKIPIRLFKTKEQGIQWVSQFKMEHAIGH